MFNRIRWGAVALIASSISANAQSILGPDLGVWTGFYVGAGVSISKTTLGFPNGSGVINLSDTTAPGVSTYQQTYPMGKDLWADGTFVDFGARYQINRVVIGADFDMEFGKKKALPPTLSQLDGIAGVFTTGNFPSLGMNSFGGSQTLGHLRGILGFSVTPKVLLFGSAGVSKARFFETGVNISGAVASSPSAPLVGAASTSVVPGEKYGRSLGFGIDVKATDNVIARIEYINDHYNFPISAGGVGFGGTIGELTTNAFITTGGKVTYDINTVRASLNYRFGPSDPSSQIAKLTSQDSYGKWGGFYVGFGETATHNKTETNGIDRLTISDNLGNIPFSYSRNPMREGDRNYEHLFAGYMHQFWRIIVGVEVSHNFNSEFDYRLYPVSANTVTGVNFISAPGSGQCGIFVTGAFTCVGGRFYGAFKATDHIRGIVGFEVLPSLMVFGSGGVVRGEGHFQAVSASGFVASSPSAPLVGKATVSNPQTKTVWGNSIGGGIQYKMVEHFSLRVEYLRDSANMPITGGGAGFGGTIGNQTTNFFISSGTREKFVNESWRVALIYNL